MLFSSTFIYNIHSNTSYFIVAQHLSYTLCKFNHHQCSSASKLWLSGWNNKMPHLKTVNDWTYWFSKFCRTCASSVGDTMSVWYVHWSGNIAFPCCFAFKLILRACPLLCITLPWEFLHSILPNLVNQLFPVYLCILTGNHYFLTRITFFQPGIFFIRWRSTQW